MASSNQPRDVPDAHHIEKLRQELWRGQIHGRVAVLVGAGMSANADPIGYGRKPMPMFRELAIQMWKELHQPTSQVPPLNQDPISVASDYEATFGTHALHEFLRRELADHSYHPTRIHRLLMSLP